MSQTVCPTCIDLIQFIKSRGIEIWRHPISGREMIDVNNLATELRRHTLTCPPRRKLYVRTSLSDTLPDVDAEYQPYEEE